MRIGMVFTGKTGGALLIGASYNPEVLIPGEKPDGARLQRCACKIEKIIVNSFLISFSDFWFEGSAMKWWQV